MVTAAPVYTSATTRKVLTTGWINGARLDESKEGDIPKLCAVALTAYLSMLLDLGFLHADTVSRQLIFVLKLGLCPLVNNNKQV